MKERIKYILMRLPWRLFFGLILLGVCMYLLYQNIPRTKEVTYQVSKLVPEMRTKEFTTSVTLNGEEVEIVVPIEDTVYKPVPEKRTQELVPTIKDYVRLGIIVLAVVCCFRFVWIVFSAYERDLKVGGRPTATTRDTQAKADKTLTFLMGLIVGFAGAGQQEPIILQPTISPPAEVQTDARPRTGIAKPIMPPATPDNNEEGG